MEKVFFLPEPGDVLIWHAQLLHGGAPILNPGERRRSVVTHYWTALDFPNPSQRIDLGQDRWILRRPPQYVVDDEVFGEVDAFLATLPHAADMVSGQARAITSGNRNDTEPRWSPDGSQIAFASSDLDRSLFEDIDIFTVSASGGTPVRISEPRVGCARPRWSPDGKRIAYTATMTDAGTSRIWIAPAAGKGRSVLAARELSFVPGEYEWAEDGSKIDAGFAVAGEHHVYRIDPSTGKFTPLTSGARAIAAFDSSEHTGITVFASNDANSSRRVVFR